MAELADQYAALWESSDSPPDVFAYLEQQSEASIQEKLAVLLQDQRRRWKTDQPLKVEDYLAQLSGLGSDQDIKLQLAVGARIDQIRQPRGRLAARPTLIERFRVYHSA